MIFFSPPGVRYLSNATNVLTKLSSTHRGTEFEKRSLRILQENLSMTLTRVGGKSDGGVDLLGWWWLPAPDVAPSSVPNLGHTHRRRIRVLAQCKAEQRKMGPKYVREMEGVFLRYMASNGSSHTAPDVQSSVSESLAGMNATSTEMYHHNFPLRAVPTQAPLVALLISESPFTTSTVLRAQSSPVPFFLLHIPPLPNTASSLASDAIVLVDSYDDSPEKAVPDKSHGWMGTAIWNPALSGKRGLLGGQIELRWERSVNGRDGRPSLWWGSRRLGSWTPDTHPADVDR